ncbi:RING finger protein nhl-1 [Armadillidium nasatum]|uniref:RING finger protein nhl-1 n=1 Tax=Armadillidium nasatum TaxID=96803 RepID=A0A5N5T6M6_9CRUS|nr:RING finger protein nhl-1 [Armadillidium nasatum]
MISYIIFIILIRMEEIVLCNICAHQFDSLHFIPKMLECGHTFCSPCMTKLFQKNHTCPNCRAEINGIEGSLPINYNTLKAVDIYKSKSWLESEMVTSIEDMKKKCVKRKEILSKSKSSITSSLEVLDKCLEKLEELTVSERRVDAVNVKKILHEVEEDFRKTMVDMFYDDIKSTVSILLSDFKDSKGYLEEENFDSTSSIYTLIY